MFQASVLNRRSTIIHLYMFYKKFYAISVVYFCFFFCAQRKPSPYETATFLSQLTWWWQNGQIWHGWRRPLQHEDLPDLNQVDKSRNVAPVFQKNLNAEMRRVG